MLRRPFPKPPLVPTILGGGALALVVGLTFLACGGSKRREVDDVWSDERREETHPLRETEELNAQPAEADAGNPSAMLGVRHDLMIAPAAKHEAKCSCLAVEAGDPSDPSLQWQNGAPEVGANAMVVAVSAHGVACEGGASDESKRRPSISAVDHDGADVIIVIEELPEGRPIASGAIIPRPAAGGGLFVRPRKPKLPYAKPASGQRYCKVL